MTETAQSPFLPDGRQWAWDSTALGLAKECPRKYYYVMKLGFRSRADNVHLVFGSHYAKALETYHKLRVAKDHDEALRSIVEQVLQWTWDDGPWTPDHNFKTRETLLRSIIWYLEEFRDDPCETVILASGEPAVELSFQFKFSDDITLCGHLDRLVSYAGQYYVQDQKTTGSALGQYYFKRYSPDNQMSLYSVAGKVVWDVPIAGVIVDAAQVAVGFTRFERGFTHRTELQLEEWLKNAEWHINNIWEAEAKGYPMNDKSCMNYGGCPFLEVCSKDPRVRMEYLQGSFDKSLWNPLAKR